MKVDPTRPDNDLNVACERKKGVKYNSEVFDLSNQNGDAKDQK